MIAKSHTGGEIEQCLDLGLLCYVFSCFTDSLLRGQVQSLGTFGLKLGYDIKNNFKYICEYVNWILMVQNLMVCC
jgi:hypothetical protein